MFDVLSYQYFFFLSFHNDFFFLGKVGGLFFTLGGNDWLNSIVAYISYIEII